MADWMRWFGWAGGLIVLEMFTGTFYLLMIALGFAAGGMAGWLGYGAAVQCLSAAIVGMVSIVLLRRSKLAKAGETDAARDPNVNLDIGQRIVIDQWSTPIDGLATARVMYRGAMWDIGLARGSTPEPGEFVITEIHGSRLIVSKP